MENITEINCPNCKQKVNVSADNKLKLVCPNCSSEIDLNSKPNSATKKSKYAWIYSTIIGAIIYYGYKYYNTNTDQNFVDRSQKNTENVISSTDNNELVYKENLNALIQAVDITNETTNDFAVQLASQFPGEYNIGQICQIYDYVVNNWKYVNDSDKKENFRSASRSINNNLSGDCDDFAILMAALIESIGGDARISFAYNENDGHAFTEVLASNSEAELQTIVNDINLFYKTDQFTIHSKVDSDGKCWLNLDWFGEPQHPGGEYFNYTKRTIYYPTINTPTYIQEVNE